MSDLKTITLRGGDFSVKYYHQGSGDHLVFLHTAGGLPAFTPELQEFSKRFTVTAPLLPGFGSTGEEHLHEDVQKLVFWGWDLLDALKIERAILVGHSFGGMMAAEMAATEPGRVKKLVLVAPAGLFLAEDPTLDFFACSPDKLAKAAFHDPNSEVAKAFVAVPSDPGWSGTRTVRILDLASEQVFLVWDPPRLTSRRCEAHEPEVSCGPSLTFPYAVCSSSSFSSRAPMTPRRSSYWHFATKWPCSGAK